MKKALAILACLVMVFTVTAAALAEETTAPLLVSGVQFNMNMDQVMQLVNLPNPEIDMERTRGSVAFKELEYENIQTYDGYRCDMKFMFVEDSLVAVHFDMVDGISYETVKAQLEEFYGKAAAFDAAKVGNGKYAIDDDGNLRDCKEMFEAEGFTIVLEQDREGDVDVTILDPAAAYIQ